MRNLIKLSLFLFIALIGLVDAHQGVAHVDYQQPGGKKIKLHVIGDQNYSRTETVEGYTVVFNMKDKTYYYARLNADGSEFVATKVKAGDAIPANLEKKLKLTPGSRARKARERGNDQLQVERNAKWQKRLQESKDKREKKVKLLRERKAKKEKEKKQGEGARKPAGDDGDNAGARVKAAEVDGVGVVEPELESGIAFNGASSSLNASVAAESIVGLTILVQFPDDPNTAEDDAVSFPAAHEKIDRYCNEQGYNDDGNTGSIRDYFFDQSNGNLDYTMSVTQIVTLPEPRNYYNFSDFPQNTTIRDAGEAGNLLVRDAAAILVSQGFDFSSLSYDGTNVLSTNIFFAGNTSGVWAQGLWPHQWGMYALARPEITVNGQTRYLHQYQITNLTSNSATIGTFCHESGHLILDYPDLYDYGGDSSGIGTHGLMASGNHVNGGKTPTPINLYLKDVLGWANIIDIAPFEYVEAALPATGNVGYRYINLDNTDEFFLVENRGYGNGAAGGDKWARYAADQGIMIWHVDEGVSGNDDQQMTLAEHYQVSLQQQDGEFDLEGNRGADSQDLYDASSPLFDNNSFPNANWWNGDASDFTVNVESNPGAIMNVTFGVDEELLVISPNGGELLIAGTDVTITWVSSIDDNVRIDLLKGGVIIDTIASNVANNGNYLWTVGSGYVEASDYRIRISSVNDATMVDESEGDFSIGGEQFAGEGVIPDGWLKPGSATKGWIVASDEVSEGQYSLKNDDVSDDETAEVEYSTETDTGVVSFDGKVSSENNYDFLRFYIDDVEQDLDVSSSRSGISGDSGWVSYSFPVTAGEHTFKWSYEKDFSVSSLQDTAWIDNVVIPEVPEEVLTGVNLWREDYFPKDGDTAGDGGNEADPDGDGISNLMEYALGLDPTEMDAGNGVKAEKSDNSLSLIYTKNMNATDVLFEVQHVADLSGETWAEASVVEEMMSVDGNVGSMKATMTVPEDGEYHFMRLKVELQP